MQVKSNEDFMEASLLLILLIWVWVAPHSAMSVRLAQGLETLIGLTRHDLWRTNYEVNQQGDVLPTSEQRE